MKRFKILIFLLIFFVSGTFLFIPQENKDNKTEVVLYHSYEPYKIFNELYDLVSSNKNINKLVFETIDFIKQKIDNKELLLLVDHKNESKNILSGAFFVASFYDPEKNKPYILFNKNIIDVFYHQKSIIFSMFMHEIKHAYDYYTNYELFKVTTENLLEEFMFQMDALYIEVLLIDNYLIPNNFSLTDFEKLLLESHKENNLHEYSLIFETTDMKMIYYFYKLFDDNNSYENNFEEIIKVGNALLENFNEVENFRKIKDEDDEWNKYQVLVSAYSFVKFVKQITYNIINTKYKNMSPEEFNLNDYSPELFDLNNTITEKVTPYIDIIYKFRNNNISKIDKIYESFSNVPIMYEYLILNRELIYLHIVPSDMLKLKDNVSKNEYLGSIEKIPDTLSKKYNNLIYQSIELYNKKNYEQAAKILEIAVKNEPDNPFILNYYAKALYWFDNDNSYKYYKKLIDLLDNQKYGRKFVGIKKDRKNLSDIKNDKLKKEIKEISLEITKISKNKVVVDYWFTEAYWKLGTLYLDRGDYLRGIFEITRSMSTSEDYDLLREQAYSFLCESYCFLDKSELAYYCADQVFKINPDNKYVLKFLNMLENK